MRLPILSYHRVEEIPHDTAHPKTFVRPAQFKEQLAALSDWGYRSVTIDDWLAYREGRLDLTPRPVILTFDDGYRSIIDNAWPMLRTHGFRATTFLVTRQLGGTNAWDAGERQVPLLSADEVLALGRDGMAFGSHTRTHRPLTRLSATEMNDELSGSRRDLAELLGGPPRTLAYPFNTQDAAVRRATERAGYAAAVRGTGRMNWRMTHPLTLRRITVHDRMSVRDLRWRLHRERWLRL